MFDVIHQWICLNELYKLMESFFRIPNSFSNLIFDQKPKFFQKKRDVNTDQIAMC